VPTTILILNAVLITAVVGVIVGGLLYAIKTSPTEAKPLHVARRPRVPQARVSSARAARPRASARPVLDR
jgi:hypothetical protein